MVVIKRACLRASAHATCRPLWTTARLWQYDFIQLPKISNGSCHLGGQKRSQSASSDLQASSSLTLAIETSCDDTSVAILEKKTGRNGRAAAKLHFHDKVTSNNLEYRGVHPTVALVSHQQELGNLVQRALKSLPPLDSKSSASSSIQAGAKHDPKARRIPDFVSVTRGPGMRSNLSVGLDTAKGLSLAWGVPLVAVNHMQAHALTPRLVSALGNWPDGADDESLSEPAFPFLSLLVSGGHTMLINSISLTSHPILAETIDTAVGDYIDKAARAILPPATLAASTSAMYGPVLEAYAFPPPEDSSKDIDYGYVAPRSHRESFARRQTPWSWSLAPPFSQGPDSPHARNNAFTFAGLGSVVQRLGARSDLKSEERRDLAREAMRVVFEHLASRIIAALQTAAAPPKTLVVAGGVAANRYLRHILRAYLDAWGFGAVRLLVPPPSLCTDNAAMIAWTGFEMCEAGWHSDLSCRPLRRWGLDENGEDGGVLGVGGWAKVVP